MSATTQENKRIKTETLRQNADHAVVQAALAAMYPHPTCHVCGRFVVPVDAWIFGTISTWNYCRVTPQWRRDLPAERSTGQTDRLAFDYPRESVTE